MEFKYKQDNLEVRSTDSKLSGDYPHTTAEIIYWNDNTCYTIAFWEKTSESYNLKFVSDRPFDEKNIGDFMKVAKIGQELLTKD